MRRVARLFVVASLCLFFLMKPAGPLLASSDTGSADSRSSFPSVTLWPLAYHAQDGDQVRTDILYPVFHYKRDETYSRFAVRPFVYNLEQDSELDRKLLEILWPFSRFKREGENYDRYVFPFYFSSSDTQQTTFHIWPFYRHRVEAGGLESWAGAYPFFQYRQNESGGMRQFDYLWPLGRWRSTDDTSQNYLLPLWWREQTPEATGGFVFPYFWYQNETSRHDAAFPLWYRGRGASWQTDLLAPFWYDRTTAEQNFRTLFPLYWHSDTAGLREWSLFLPLYGDFESAENQYRLIFPFYFRHASVSLDSELRYYFPLYGDYRKGSTVHHRYYLFPLYAHIQDREAEREAWYYLWPLVYLNRAPEQSDTWVIPFYWGKQSPERRFRVALIPPYLEYADQNGREERHLWPFYGLKKDAAYVERSVVWPLFRWGRSPDGERRAWEFLLAYRSVAPERSVAGFFPLWHYDREEDRVRNISLLHWKEKGPEASLFALLHLGDPDWSLYTLKREPQRSYQHLFPLYSLTEQDSGEKTISALWPIYRYHTTGQGETSHQLLWKLLYAEHSDTRDERGFLWRFIRSKRDDVGRLFEFNPFYYSEERSNGDRYASWLGGLYASRKDATGSSRTLFWVVDY